MQGNKRTYIIGEYEFDNFYDYRDAQEDLRKIEIINKELDVHDPEVAIRLYNMIRDGKIEFMSPIGEDFFGHVADILADKSINLLDNKAIVETAASKTKRQRRLGILIVVLAIAFSCVFGYFQVKDIMVARKQEQRAAQRQASERESAKRLQIAKENAKALEAASIDRKDPFAERKSIDKTKLTILPEYEDLYAENSDLVGWIKIADTQIDYPIVQSVDNSFYLNRDFNKSSDSNGSIFMDYRSDNVNVTTNTIIYGHNMNSGMMFGGLEKYLEEDYFNKHKEIEYDSIFEQKKFEIVAVCLTEVAYQIDNDFRYYNFIQAENEAEWQAYVDNVSELSVFSNEVDLEAGDEVLTLSTCNNYTEDGRLFLVAKRID